MSEEDAGEGGKHQAALVEAALDAGRRSRRVFLLLQILTLLVAASILNAPQFGWVDEYLSALRLDLALLQIKDHPPLRVRPIEQTDSATGRPNAEFEDWLRAWRVAYHAESQHRTLLTEADIESGARDLALGDLSEEEMKERLRLWTQFRSENSVTLPVPVVNLRIDAVDLGIFAGLGFSICLVWLGLSLTRERRNLGTIRRSPRALEIVASYQVFTEVKRGKRALPRVVLPYVGIGLPALLIFYNLYIDIQSREIGTALSEPKTRNLLVTETSLALLNIGCILWCMKQHWLLVRTWRTPPPPAR